MRRLCEDEAAAQIAFSVRVASKLKARLADLEAAHDLSEVLVGRLRLGADPMGIDLVLELSQDSRMLLRVNHEKVPRGQDGGVDFARVTRLKIMGFERINA